ncbi:tryptophan halogenase family protein [Massilia luteola]|uniref:tryptophan halogenase family protein n=1 Tax=Massilia luteola TaxID=3081751 RepID=UPI002ACBE42C|nr:tryptophan halogenase family protein [Massilia sp. Gc5]
MTYERIVVLGGGTSGWMTAAALATGLKGTTVELVESEDIGIVGVGEATFPSIRAYHQILGIPEADFLRATNGTYKLGIKFRDWRVRGEDYYHTFGDFGQLAGPDALWGQYRRHVDAGLPAFGEQCLPTVMALNDRFCAPGKDAAHFNYAYHFDANLYARFLRDIAIARGVRRTEGKVVDVARRQDGGVASLTLDDGRVVGADLFIDCSGFTSLLLGRTLDEPFVDFSRWLPVDRAWACPSARVGAGLTPYTRATALDAGWAWRIPLQDRTGNGHVFSSRFIDEDKAREQLLQQLDGEPLAEPRLLRFTTGHRARFWSHNVVGIGLSTGFLEPLESTSIYLVQVGIGRLMTLLQRGGTVAPAAIDAYNTGLVHQFERIRDFILMHYCLTGRRDTPFWTAMAATELPETLAYKLHAWRQTGTLHQYDEEGFDGHSWLAIHAGMHNWPERSDPTFNQIPAEKSLEWVRERARQLADAVGSVSTHEDYLARVLRR